MYYANIGMTEATPPVWDHNARRGRHTKVCEIAFDALLLVITPSHAANELRTAKMELPQAMRSAIDSGDEAVITAALKVLVTEHSAALNRTLVICYQLALFAASVRRALLGFLATCPLAPGAFKGVRHIFKAAELRIDEEVFARLSHRFEITPAFFNYNIASRRPTSYQGESHVPQHPYTVQLRASRHPGGNPRRLTPVRAQAERLRQTLTSQ
jgi:hypothetical protein